MDIQQLQSQLSQASGDKQYPPVDKWDPEYCGEMPLVIKRNGQWWHQGTPFTRAKLVALFSSVLKKEEDRYFLVTPVEKIGIQVEDVPFVAIDADTSDTGIQISTQVGDKVLISEQHPVELRTFEDAQVPYVNVRRNLWARVHQNVLYRWVDQAEHVSNGNKTELFLTSNGYRFSIGEF
ncbi:DUF1285 domain-containing protein [Glaciecola sp. 1036]|uniref:DUF1285 domain-containing protein n=1 Tax=Alteromonadaceae TaxID=72275 RepID=UPI003D016B39